MVLRSFLFAAEGSRLGKNTPSDQAAFDATKLAVNNCIARRLMNYGESLVWPSLAEAEDALEELQQSDKVVSALQT